MADDIREQLAALAATLASVESVLDLDKLRKELAELENDAADPDLWNDQERAQQVTSRMSYLRGDLQRLQPLRGRIENAQAPVHLHHPAVIQGAGADQPPAPP